MSLDDDQVPAFEMHFPTQWLMRGKLIFSILTDLVRVTWLFYRSPTSKYAECPLQGTHASWHALLTLPLLFILTLRVAPSFWIQASECILPSFRCRSRRDIPQNWMHTTVSAWKGFDKVGKQLAINNVDFGGRFERNLSPLNRTRLPLKLKSGK